MIRQVIALAGSLALGVGIAAGSVALAVDQAHGAGTDQDPPIRTEYQACGQEQVYRNCVWDAQERGGSASFFAGRDARIWVLPHHIAHYLLNGDNARGTYFACPVPVTSDPVSCIWEETVWLGREGDDTVIPHHVARFLLAR